MNQKGIAPLIIVAIVVVVAVAAGVGIYVATRGEGGEAGGGPGGGGGAGGEGVAGATSLDFKVDGRWGDASGTLRFRGKNLGTTNIKIRFDATLDGEETRFIIDNAERRAWAYSGGEWEDVSAIIDIVALPYSQAFSAHWTALQHWTGGDYTYTDPSTGTTVRIYDIVVNPSLPDSLFRPD